MNESAHDSVSNESVIDNISSNRAKHSLFFLHDLVRLEPGSNDFKSKRINVYMNDEKLNLLETLDFKSVEFGRFVKATLDNSQLRGAYLLGHRVTHLDWILEFFHLFAQTRSFNIMFYYARNLVNRLLRL